MRLILCVSAACGLACSGAAQGQVLGPLVQANKGTTTPGVWYEETAIAVNPANEDDLVALAIQGNLAQPGSSSKVYLFATLTGGQTFYHQDPMQSIFPGGVFPGCAYNPGGPSVDPFATASRSVNMPSSNHIWFGCQTSGQGFPGQGGEVVVVKAPGASAFILPSTGAVCAVPTLAPPPAGVYAMDQPCLAVGPRTDGQSGDAVYLTFDATRNDLACGIQTLFGMVSVSNFPIVPPGLTWPQTWPPPGQAFAVSVPANLEPNCGEFGWGMRTVVIRSGPHAGRIVAAYVDKNIDPYGTPSVIWSNNPSANTAANWNPTHGPFDPLDPQISLATDGIILAMNRNNIPPGNLSVRAFPSIAVDPNVPDLIYVAFAGRPLASSWVTDIYVAKSVDGGGSFPQDVQGGGKVIHLTDAMLGNDPGTYKFHPAITVDQYGGLNLMYYRLTASNAPTGPRPKIEVRFARIKNLGESNQSIVNLTLTPSPTDTDLTDGWIGDYHAIATAGCSVWACFSSGHDFVVGSNPPIHAVNYYIRRITLLECAALADFNASGQVESSDILAFADAYSAAQPTADVNHDSAINPNDWQCFINAYTCGCNH